MQNKAKSADHLLTTPAGVAADVDAALYRARVYRAKSAGFLVGVLFGAHAGLLLTVFADPAVWFLHDWPTGSAAALYGYSLVVFAALCGVLGRWVGAVTCRPTPSAGLNAHGEPA